MSSCEYFLIASDDSMSMGLEDYESSCENIDIPPDHFGYRNVKGDESFVSVNRKDLPPLPSEPEQLSSTPPKRFALGVDRESPEKSAILPSTLSSSHVHTLSNDTNAVVDAFIASALLDNMTIKTYADATNIATKYPELAPTVLTMPLTSIASSLPQAVLSPTAPIFVPKRLKEPECRPHMPAHTDEQPNWALAPDPDPNDTSVESRKRATSTSTTQRSPKVSSKPLNDNQQSPSRDRDNPRDRDREYQTQNQWETPSSHASGQFGFEVPPMVQSNRGSGSSGGRSQDGGYSAKYDYGLNYDREAPTPPYMRSLPGSEQNTGNDTLSHQQQHQQQQPRELASASVNQFEYVPPSASAWDVPGAGTTAAVNPSIDESCLGSSPKPWQSGSSSAPRGNPDAWSHAQTRGTNYTAFNSARHRATSRIRNDFAETRDDGWSGSLPASAYGSSGGRGRGKSRSRSRSKRGDKRGGGRGRRDFDQGDSHRAQTPVEDDGWTGSSSTSSYGACGGRGRSRGGRDKRASERGSSHQSRAPPQDDGWSGSLPASAYGSGEGRGGGRGGRRNRGDRDSSHRRSGRSNPDFAEDHDKRHKYDDGRNGEWSTSHADHYNDDEWTGSLPASAYGAFKKGKGRGGREREKTDSSRGRRGRESERYNPPAFYEPSAELGGGRNDTNTSHGNHANPYTPQNFEDDSLSSCDPNKGESPPKSHSNTAPGNHTDYVRPHPEQMWLSTDSHMQAAPHSAASQTTGPHAASSDARCSQGVHHPWTTPQLQADIYNHQQQSDRPNDVGHNLQPQSDLVNGRERRRSVSQTRESQVAAIIAATHKHLSPSSPSHLKNVTPSQDPAETPVVLEPRVFVADAVKEPTINSRVPKPQSEYSPGPFPQRQGRTITRMPPEEVQPGFHQERSASTLSSVFARTSNPYNLNTQRSFGIATPIQSRAQSSAPCEVLSPSRPVAPSPARSVGPSPARSVAPSPGHSRESSTVHSKLSPARPGAHSPAGFGEIGQGRASTSLFRDVHVHQRINTPPPILVASNMGLPDPFGTGEETLHAMGVVKTPVLGHVSMSGVFEKENTTSLSGMSAISVPLPHELDYAMNTHGPGVAWSSPRMPAPEA